MILVLGLILLFFVYVIYHGDDFSSDFKPDFKVDVEQYERNNTIVMNHIGRLERKVSDLEEKLESKG